MRLGKMVMPDQSEDLSALTLSERVEVCRKLAAEAEEEARKAEAACAVAKAAYAAFLALAEQCRAIAAELERRQRSALGV